MALKDDLTEDLIQEVLLEMIRSLRNLRNVARFWPWLLRIAHTKVADHFRGRHRVGQTGLPTDPDGQALDLPDCRLPEPAEELGRGELLSDGHIVNCGFGFNAAEICGGALSDCHGSITDCVFTDNALKGHMRLYQDI